MKRAIEFLGHVLEENKIYPSSGKIKAVIDFSKPKWLKEL